MAPLTRNLEQSRGRRPRSFSAGLWLAGLGICSLWMHGVTLRAQDSQPTTETKAVVNEPAIEKWDLEEFPKGWKCFASEDGVPLLEIWKVVKLPDDKVPYLQCVGKPYGYLRSEKQYDDFEFGFEWRFPTDPNGNSGVLIYTGEEDKIWPNSIQVQLHGATTGSIFPLGDSMTANNLQVRDKVFAANQWHTCVIRGEGGTISVTMNGVKQGEITGSNPKTGNIALQSEGSEVHFRNIWVRNLKAATVEKPVDDENEASVGQARGERNSPES